MSRPACVLSPKGSRWARTGHPWVYRDDLVRAEGENGDIVDVVHEGRVLGTAFLSRASKIALRWIERGEEPREPDRVFWRERLEQAVARRRPIEALSEAYRVLHDAADGFPGLVADRYGRVGVLQSTTPGMERWVEAIGEDLQTVLGLEAVILRNDVSIRKKEGLPLGSRVLRGAVPAELWVAEEGPTGRIEYRVDPVEGQKTGAYLDQRENRWRLAELAKGRMLDLFSHTGLFSLHAARRVSEAVVVDTSESALEACEAAAERVGLGNLRTVARNVFDYLKDARQAGERFETISVDPPAFARSRADVEAALRGYREINRRAMELLRPGGILMTCSCSYNLGEEGFIEVLREAAAAARADFILRERRSQSSDHPSLLCHPESRYLKCVVLEKTTGD